MGNLAIFALGPLRIELDGKPLQTSRHKALALLVYLAMNREKQSREMLSTFLWPEYEQKKSLAYLRRTLWEIRTLLGEGWMDADREGIWLSPNTYLRLDVTEFNSHLVAFRKHDHSPSNVCQECIAHLHKAALLYRGDFLAGFNLRDSTNFEDWQFFQSEAQRRDYASALQKLASLLQHAESYPEATMFAQRWLALDNFNEEAHRLLMKIYALEGQRHKALRQYQECKRILHTELGVSPEQATTALYESIISGNFSQGYDPLLRQSNIMVQQASEANSVLSWLGEALPDKDELPLNNLPTPATPFVGRKQELHTLNKLLAEPDCWLLTLLGPGGIGKTRLAIEVGLRQLSLFPHGVHFIPLSTVETETSLIPAIARSLGLFFRQIGPAPEEQLLDFLREKRLLLILDAFEQLVQWPNLLGKIHSHATGIKLLVTSRHRLLLQGEWVLEVKGLDHPLKQPEKPEVIQSDALQTYSAVELFLQAARRARVTFQPSPEDFSLISQITQLLEGMPLGLELAATWVNTLSCQEIVDEINSGLDILETTLGDISERQRSIRAVFDHSWNLLSAHEQAILPRLAVFRGSFSRQAAEQIAGISLRELSGLVDKSLVRRTPQGRFDLHDLMRQYITEKLDRLTKYGQETRHRHCAYFSTRLAQWNTALNGERQGQVLRNIEAELENIQVAWDWAVDHQQIEILGQAIDGLCMFYLRRALFAEGRDACQNAVKAIREITPYVDHTQYARLFARALIWQSAMNLNLECFEDAEHLLQESQLILDDPQLDQKGVVHERIFALVNQVLLAHLRYDPGTSIHCFEQALHLSRKASGKGFSFWIFFWRFLMGGGPISKELFLLIEQNQTNRQQGGNPFEIGCNLFTLGIAELFHYYHMDKAESLLRESCTNFRLVEDPSTQVMVFKTLGYLLDAQGKFEDFYALKQRELEIFQDLGDHRMIGVVYAEVGEALCHLGKYSEAEGQIRMGMALLQGRSEIEHALRHRYLGDVLLAQGRNHEAKKAYQFSYRFFQSVNDQGWTLTALTGLSRTEFALGDLPSAWSHARQALYIYNEARLFTFFVYLTVAEIALLLADRGEIIRALELYGLVIQQGYLAQSRWFDDLFGRLIIEAASQLSVEEQAAAIKSGQGKDLSRTINTLLPII